MGTAVLLGWSFFATTVRLDLRRFFQVTGFLLLLFAAGLVGRGAGELVVVGWIPPLIGHVWDLGGILSAESLLGQTLGALFGYSCRPFADASAGLHGIHWRSAAWIAGKVTEQGDRAGDFLPGGWQARLNVIIFQNITDRFHTEPVRFLLPGCLRKNIPL